MDKLIYVGTSILDISKYLMYDYFYNNLTKRYGEKIVLLSMDIDSFILEINTDDVYEDLKEDEDTVFMTQVTMILITHSL